MMSTYRCMSLVNSMQFVLFPAGSVIEIGLSEHLQCGSKCHIFFPCLERSLKVTFYLLLVTCKHLITRKLYLGRMWYFQLIGSSYIFFLMFLYFWNTMTVVFKVTNVCFLKCQYFTTLSLL